VNRERLKTFTRLWSEDSEESPRGVIYTGMGFLCQGWQGSPEREGTVQSSHTALFFTDGGPPKEAQTLTESDGRREFRYLTF